ncbi:hypothetical protein HDV01_006711 [Terramyces sp. JEL0728]|nr:hypothetical protein HDV01_006711 [Terramyces sp. JEL0728]
MPQSYQSRQFETEDRILAKGWNRHVLAAIKKLVQEEKLISLGHNRYILPGKTDGETARIRNRLATPKSVKVSSHGLITPPSSVRLRKLQLQHVSHKEIQSPETEMGVDDSFFETFETLPEIDFAPSPSPNFHSTQGVDAQVDFDLERQLQEMESKVQEKTVESDMLKDQVARLRFSQESMMNLVAAIKQAFRNDIQSSNTKIGGLNSALAEKETAINKLNRANSTLKQQLDDVEMADQLHVTQLAEKDELHLSELQAKQKEIAMLLKEQLQMKNQLEGNMKVFQSIDGILQKAKLVLH